MSVRRYGFIVVTAFAFAIVGAAPAAAHVTVQPGEASRGGYAKLAFRVPNESETAGTVKLTVTFPQDTPLSSARTKPKPGWTAEIRKDKLATPIKIGEREVSQVVRTVTWTAQPGTRVGPGEFEEFELSVGPLPDTDRLLLPAVQTYDDGRAVSWDTPPAADGAQEPQHPAPVLTLTAGGGGHSASAVGSSASDAHEAQQAASGSDETARWLGGAGLAVGALGAGLAGGAMIAGRRRGTGSV